MPLNLKITGEIMASIKKIKLHIVLFWAAVLAAGIWTLDYSTGSINSVVVAIAVVGFIVSIVKSYKNDGFIGDSFALKTTAGRVPVYDYIRFVAVVLVIVVHVIGVDLDIAVDMAGTPIFAGLDFARWWALNCNVLFVMLSGALLLPYKKEPVLSFYGKRLTKIVIPLVVYYMWYYTFFGQRTEGTLDSPLEIVLGILTADIKSVGAYHFWLLYVIIAIYIVVPFLRMMLRDLSYQHLTGIVVVTVIILTYATYLPLKTGFDVSYLGWCGVAIAGYWCSKDNSRKYDNWLIILGIVASVAMWLVFKYDLYYSNTLWNLSPYRVVVGLGLFAIFFKLKNGLRDFCVIRLVSKYGFSIMLIHYWIIGNVLRKICGIGSVMYKGFGAVISVVVTLVLSFIAAYLIDNLIVSVFSSLIDRIKKIK